MTRKSAFFFSIFAMPSMGCAQEPRTQLPFKATQLAVFNQPWAMTFLPGSGERMTSAALVTEKAGRLMLVDTLSGKITPVTGVPVVADGGQGGFGDVMADPGFAGNGRVWVSWVEAGPGNTFGAVVGHARLVLGETPHLENLAIVWKQDKTTGRGHFGHRLAFAADGSLFISSGERQKFDPAQDPNTNLGKVIRLTAEGQPQNWSMGHRNPLGLAFDGQGRLWEIEMGPMGGDEMNLIKQGANYGYPRASNGSHYDGRDIPDHTPGDGFEAPKIWWNPSISPSSLMIYSGHAFPQWTGDAFIGALSGQALIHIKLDGEQASKADQWDMGARIREVEQGPDGAIWVLEDGTRGRLLKLMPNNGA